MSGVPGVRVGQVWADNDPRAAGRTVRVDAVDCRFAECTVLTAIGGQPPRVSRKTRIDLARMKPLRTLRTGYRLVSEPEGGVS